MRNRAVTLLALLDANDRFGQPEIYRTALMKQAFLADTIRPLYRQWRQLFTFVRYFHGPYSEDLFQRLDVLIFNGLVEVTSFAGSPGHREARYRITAAGRVILKEIDANEISELATDLVWSLQTLGVEQAGTITKLVYEEAEFARLFAQHKESDIPANAKVQLPTVTSANNETLTILATLQGLRDQHLSDNAGDAEFILPARELVRLYLECLALQVPRQKRGKNL